MNSECIYIYIYETHLTFMMYVQIMLSAHIDMILQLFHILFTLAGSGPSQGPKLQGQGPKGVIVMT